MKRAVLATALCALMATGAHALTQAEVNACYFDAVRICGVTSADRNAGALRRLAIGVCMIAHRSQLSPRCDAVLKAHGY